MAIISIIIPVYNVELYLERCVESVKGQLFTNIEIILVDDGSTDSSGEICERLKKTDNRIKVIHKPNGGLSSARNAGIKIATGEYIGFVDSDDWITKDMYKYLYYLMQKYEADIVSCDYILANDNSIIKKKNRYSEKVFDKNEALNNYLESGIYKRKNDYAVWKKLYKKKFFEKISFPEGKLYEDMATNLLILKNCERYVLSNKQCYYYYQNSQSITRKVVSTKHFDLLYTAKQINEILQVENKELRKYGQLQIVKAYFSLLVKIARFGHTDEIREDYVQNSILLPFKKDINVFIKSKFSFMMKLIALSICINWNFTKKVLSFL